MGTLHVHPNSSSAGLDANTVLELAKAAELTSCVVVGFDANGKLFLSGTDANAPAISWLLARGSRAVMDMVVR